MGLVVGVVGKCVVPTERFCAGVISTTEKQVAVWTVTSGGDGDGKSRHGF